MLHKPFEPLDLDAVRTLTKNRARNFDFRRIDLCPTGD
jgi:hypothetical protein